MPGATRRLRNLARRTPFRFSLDNRVRTQWKQWTTDAAWSKPVQILPKSEAAILGHWRPATGTMEF
eukprot:811069-Lingulodinium_polyedra.AAC.1